MGQWSILDDWDGVIMAGAGPSEEVLSEGAPDVLDEKWRPLFSVVHR